MDDSIFIRDIGPADIDALLAINSAGRPGVSPLDAGSASALISLASVAWVAVADGRIAGYLIGFLPESAYDGAEFHWFRRRPGRFIYVDQIAIAPFARGQGIGHGLYAGLARWGTGRACATMVCEVNVVPPNPDSLAFHRRCGFAEIGRMTVPDGREVALLERRMLPERSGN